MTKNTTQQTIEEYKILINNLAQIQDKLFDDLENTLGIGDNESMSNFVFDYIYNADESSFNEYMSIYDPKY